MSEMINGRALKAHLGSSLQLLLLLSLTLRSLIAPGFMPKNLSSEGFLALCHSGLSATVAERLFGNDHAHHAQPNQRNHHHGHLHHQADRLHDDLKDGLNNAQNAERTSALTNAQLCPLGDGIGSAFLVNTQIDIERLAPTGPSLSQSSAWVSKQTLSAFQARGPPILSV